MDCVCVSVRVDKSEESTAMLQHNYFFVIQYCLRNKREKEDANANSLISSINV